MVKRFRKIDYGDAYALKDTQINGLPLIRLQYSDEACCLTSFLNNKILKLKNQDKELSSYKAMVEEYRIAIDQKSSEIKELNDKMNYQSFELYKYGVVSIGKAVELSNMSYHDFIHYCYVNGHPVELRL